MNAMIDDRPTDAILEMQQEHEHGSNQPARDEAGYGDAGYQELCGRAVSALALGLASPLAVVHVAFWPLPLIALALSVSALKRIHDLSPDVKGRGIALSALALSLIFGISGPVQPLLYRYSMRAQATSMAAEWFACLRRGDAAAAKQLTVPDWFRSTAGVSIDNYKARMTVQGGHKAYPEQPPVKLLLGLGNSAHVRLYQHLGVTYNDFDETDRVEDIYSVFDSSAAEPVGGFIKLTITRRLDLMHRVRSWEVSKAELFDDPAKAAAGEMPLDEAAADDDLEWREKIRQKIIRKQQRR